MTPEQEKLVDKLIDILYDIDDHRWEAFPYFVSKILGVFGHDVPENVIECYLKERDED